MRPRRNRFRPSFGFRPGLDLLPTRIVPSDMTPLMIGDPAPVPAGCAPDTGDTDPYTIPPATVNTLPNGYVAPSTTSSTGLTATSPGSTSTMTYSC